jgi:hypothetical protein
MEVTRYSVLAALATLLLFLTGCSDPTPSAEKSARKPVAQKQLPSDKYSDQEICKAVIARVMGRDPTIIRASHGTDNIVALSYNRQSDGKNWTYRCEVDGGSAVWASDTGRWRTAPADSKIELSLSDGDLVVKETYGDGSSSETQFSKAQLSSSSAAD